MMCTIVTEAKQGNLIRQSPLSHQPPGRQKQ